MRYRAHAYSLLLCFFASLRPQATARRINQAAVMALMMGFTGYTIAKRRCAQATCTQTKKDGKKCCKK